MKVFNKQILPAEINYKKIINQDNNSLKNNEAVKTLSILTNNEYTKTKYLNCDCVCDCNYVCSKCNNGSNNESNNELKYLLDNFKKLLDNWSKITKNKDINTNNNILNDKNCEKCSSYINSNLNLKQSNTSTTNCCNCASENECTCKDKIIDSIEKMKKMNILMKLISQEIILLFLMRLIKQKFY